MNASLYTTVTGVGPREVPNPQALDQAHIIWCDSVLWSGLQIQ